MASLVFTSADQHARYWEAKAHPDKPEMMDEFRSIIEERDRKERRRKDLDRRAKEDYESRNMAREARKYRRAMENRLKQLEGRHKYSFWRS